MTGMLINDDDDDDETQKEESPPNLLLHNWVVGGRWVRSNTVFSRALVHLALLLLCTGLWCSGVPDGSQGLAAPISSLPLHYTPLDVKPHNAQMFKYKFKYKYIIVNFGDIISWRPFSNLPLPCAYDSAKFMGEFTCLAENPVVYLWFDLLCYSRNNAEEANLLNLKESNEKHKTRGCIL